VAVFGAVAGAAGFDDLAVEGEAVDDNGAEPGVGERFRPAIWNASLEAIATADCSSLSVKTWNGSSAPLRSSSRKPSSSRQSRSTRP